MVESACRDCENFYQHFGICVINGKPTLEPPEVACREHPAAASPYPQLSPRQVKMLPKTHFEFEFDAEGWIRDVNVKGLPRATAQTPIPREPVTFSYYDQSCAGSLRYCTDPTHPGVLEFRPLLRMGERNIYKTFNSERLSGDVGPPAIALPAEFETVISVLRIVAGHFSGGASGITNLSVPDPETLSRLWSGRGYQAGTVEIEGVLVGYVAYEFNGASIVAILGGYELVRNPADILSAIRVEPTGDRKMFEKFRLSTRCMLCGYDYGHWEIPQPCSFCYRESSPIVFEG